MQCPHQEEKNWTSQAEDELLTVGFRLPLLRITSGSSSVYRRAAVPRHPGTSHRATAALNQSRSIPASPGERHTESGRSESRRVSAGKQQRDSGRHESSCSANSYVCSRQRAARGTDVSLREPEKPQNGSTQQHKNKVNVRVK